MLAGLLNEKQLAQAIARPRPAGMKLGQFLIREGIVREQEVMQALSEQLRVPLYRPEDYPMDEQLSKLVPLQIAAHHRIVPLRRKNQRLLVAMPDPTDILAMDAVQEQVQLEIEPVICSETQFTELMGSLYGVSSSSGIPDEITEVDFGTGDDLSSEPETIEEAEVRHLMDAAEGQTAVRNVNWILVQAVWEGASDIHISPEKKHVRIRLRVDGVLKDLPAWPKALHNSVVSRIKILARMDIAISRLPQDGRFSARISNREIHVRVSTLPTIHGENLVLRLLDMNALVYKLDHLGMQPDDQERIEKFIQRPHGLLLSTGPTGSGKTTTLYSILSLLNQPGKNIVTVEDPVEFRMERIRQVELNTRAGMTFASSLRSILRQDPDIIMVGEIRDVETGTIAMQAGLTGHLVLSTMHTNDAVGTITRLKDMGIQPFLIASVLRAVIAQRLVRRLCSHCAEPFSPEPAALQFWEITPENSAEESYLRARGCPQCRDTGYRGRLGIFETLLINDAIQSSILNNESENVIAAKASAQPGFRFLKEDAARKIQAGMTSLEEAASIIVI
jgi:type IV pilus assembly protein PilB